VLAAFGSVLVGVQRRSKLPAGTNAAHVTELIEVAQPDGERLQPSHRQSGNRAMIAIGSATEYGNYSTGCLVLVSSF